MKMKVKSAVFGTLLLGLSSAANAGLLLLEGNFSGTGFSEGTVDTLSGTFSASLDSSLYTGSGFEALRDLPFLTAFTLDPNPLGVTLFDTSNVGFDVNLFNGTVVSMEVGGLPDVSNMPLFNSDDFRVRMNSRDGVFSVEYTLGTEFTRPEASEFAGGFSAREIPAPSTVALLGLGLAALGYRRRKRV